MRGLVLPDLVEDADILVGDEAAGLEARAVERVFDVLEREREDEDVDDLLRQVLAEGFLATQRPAPPGRWRARRA